jgi:hypothetical protein
MLRFLTKAVIFTVSILASYLITGTIEDRVLRETEQFRPLTATLLGMAIIVAVFVPVFAYTERMTEAAIKAGLRQTKAGAGKVLGAVIFVGIIFIILLALFLDRWFGISIIDAI